ncbi:unnamed protein product, partial [Symbiodinium necroappetens]
EGAAGPPVPDGRRHGTHVPGEGFGGRWQAARIILRCHTMFGSTCAVKRHFLPKEGKG